MPDMEKKNASCERELFTEEEVLTVASEVLMEYEVAFLELAK